MNVQSRYEKYRWKQNILFNNLKPHTEGQVYKTMKQRIIVAFPTKVILIEDCVFKTIKANVYIGSECSYPCIISLLEHINLTRTINCLCELLDFNMNVSLNEFVQKYTYKDFLQIRNSGRESLSDLKNALTKLGYEW